MVYVLLGRGFEEIEAITPVDLLRRAGVEVTTVGLNGKTVTGSHGIDVAADVTVEETAWENLEMLVLPGGLGGVASIRSCPKALEAIRAAWEAGRYVAAICAGPTVLADLGITDGKNTTCYPGQAAKMGSARVDMAAPAVRDGKLITGASAGCAREFALMLVEALKGTEVAQAIAGQIVIR